VKKLQGHIAVQMSVILSVLSPVSV